jgi:hypothetical protein
VRLVIHFVNVPTFALVLTGGGPGNATQTMGADQFIAGRYAMAIRRRTARRGSTPWRVERELAESSWFASINR